MKYPYYIVPEVEAYRRLDPKSEEARAISRKIAANVGDYASLRLILGIDPPEFARFYPDMETATPTTMDTIDAFLDKFGSKTIETPGIALLDAGSEQTPYNLEETEPIPTEEAETTKKEESENTPAEPPEINLRRLIQEKRYEEAIALIEVQNLNNPQKSIYFAHQMRFLKKLIAIKNYKTQTKG